MWQPNEKSHCLGIKPPSNTAEAMNLLGIALLSATIFATNSNTCLASMPSQSCFSPTPSSLCCSQIVGWSKNRCFCNSLAVGLLEINAQAIANAVSKCGAAYNCAGFDTKTYNGGTCTQTDVQIDAARFMAARSFSLSLLEFGNAQSCMNMADFHSKLSKAIIPSAVAIASQGLGKYTGIKAIAEYFSLLHPKVNRDFLRLTAAPVTNSVALLSADGTTITFGMDVRNRYFNGTYFRNQTDYIEATFEFPNCRTLARKVTIPTMSTLFPSKITGVASLAEVLHFTTNPALFLSKAKELNWSWVDLNNFTPKLMGFQSICKQHSLFCTGANRQFQTETQCLKFYKELNGISPTCGKAAITAGNTITCRSKHQFMIQSQPDVHCPHLGPNSEACNDTNCDIRGPDNVVSIDGSQSFYNALYSYTNNLQKNNGFGPAQYC